MDHVHRSVTSWGRSPVAGQVAYGAIRIDHIPRQCTWLMTVTALGQMSEII